MESRVREKKKMNLMIDLIDDQDEKLDEIISIFSKELKSTPGIFAKINTKVQKLEGATSTLRATDE